MFGMINNDFQVFSSSFQSSEFLQFWRPIISLSVSEWSTSKCLTTHVIPRLETSPWVRPTCRKHLHFLQWIAKITFFDWPYIWLSRAWSFPLVSLMMLVIGMYLHRQHPRHGPEKPLSDSKPAMIFSKASPSYATTRFSFSLFIFISYNFLRSPRKLLLTFRISLFTFRRISFSLYVLRRF